MDIQTLTDTELLFGYKNVALYYEAFVKNNTKGYNVSKLGKFLTDNGIILTTPIEPKHLQDFENKDISFFAFSKAKKYSKVPSLFYRLRNAYAHDGVEIRKISGKDFICFLDIYRKKQTMVGQIKLDIYHEFIQELKQSK